MTRLEGQIRQLLCRMCIPGADLIDEAASLYDSGLVDSLHLIDLLAAVERQFAITIGTGEVTPENFDTIAGLTAFVAGKQCES